MKDNRVVVSSKSQLRKKQSYDYLFKRVARVLVACVVVTLCLNSLWYHSIILIHDKHDEAHFPVVPSHVVPEKPLLSCQKYGGPSDSIAQEMVYWKNFDKKLVSSPEEKYLLFDNDDAGFNNRRIGMENFVVMAYAMGRTLVLPPKTRWPNFGGKNHTTWYGFDDFFDIQAMKQGINVIAMDEFLTRYAMQGKMRNRQGEIAFPPENNTDWNHRFWGPLQKWLNRTVPTIPWRCEDCIAAFSAHADTDLQGILQHVRKLSTTRHAPPPVNGSPEVRMKEMVGNRTELCVYTREMQQEPVLYYKLFFDHFHPNLPTTRRLLIWYYLFFFFEDWRQDLLVKRLVRDGIRYRDELQCAAARVVHAIRATSSNHEFDSMHVRRSIDFEQQFGPLTPVDKIRRRIRNMLQQKTVYIATDEKNLTFFQPLRQYYNISFLRDYKHLLEGIHPDFYALIDQLVASRGNVFVGAWYSTYTGYINRLRGYHATKNKLPGYKEGALESYHYNYYQYSERDAMKAYHSPEGFWFEREYPLAWRDIDHDV